MQTYIEVRANAKAMLRKCREATPADGRHSTRAVLHCRAQIHGPPTQLYSLLSRLKC